MVKKKISLKNYLEPISQELENSFQNQKLESKKNIDEIKPYPYSKDQLLSYLISDEFLSSIEGSKETNRIDFEMNPRKILEKLPFERKTEEIRKEKRRRYQVYKSLDYFLSNSTYFDFFSFDAFKIAKQSKYLTQMVNQKEVPAEFLFLSFFNSHLQIGRFLQEFGWNDEYLEDFCFEFNEYLKQNEGSPESSTKINFFVEFDKEKVRENSQTGVLNFLKKKILNKFKRWKRSLSSFFVNFFEDQEAENFLEQKINYSYEVNQIFQKSAENALSRFKTPIITPEIIFITLMEDKTSFVSRFIRKRLANETTWYLLRYKLLKRLYNQEANTKNQVKKSQYFFAYLLKTQMAETHFERAIEKENLSLLVAEFRDIIIKEVLQLDLLESFDLETHASIAIGPQRYYSE